LKGSYKGVLKVAGPNLKGWLIDVARPARRVRFDLIVDGQNRGSFVANARRRFFAPKTGAGEDTHGFSIPIRKPWISGKPQVIRLVDPEDPMLDFSMSVRLGPKPHQHFEEHVVSGQVTLGAAERMQAADDDDEPEANAPAASANKALLRQIGALSDAELAGLLFAVDRDILSERVARYDKAGDWERLVQFRRVLAGPPLEQMLASLARGAIKAHNHTLAARVTGAAAALFPASFEANFLAGAAKVQAGAFDDALVHLRAADRLEEGGARAKREMALALTKQLRLDLPVEKRAQIREEHLSILRALATSGDLGTRVKYRVPYAAALYAAGRYDETIAAADLVLETAPNDTRALMAKARALVARNQVGEACTLYERVLDFEPNHRGARMSLRILAALIEDEAREQQSGKITVIHRRRLSFDGVPLAAALAQVPQSWISTGELGLDDLEAISARLVEPAQRRVGYVEVPRGDGKTVEVWHRDALKGLAESGLIASLDDHAALARFQPFYEAPKAGLARRGTAVLVSHNGADLYGGGEHFLLEAAELHAAQGYEPVILGTRPELEGEERVVDGRRAAFIGDQPADMRRFLLTNEVSLVHAISGMGFAVAEALAYTNIAFVYGVHFWNELLGDPQYPGYFDEVSGDALFRREFLVILARATAVYANSRYTQKLIEDGFGVRCPVLYAVPRERACVAVA
jgi:tetratricopeptide (TPR) repeat protein